MATSVHLGPDHTTIGLRPEDPPRIGPYELHGRLGAGGMGVVYLGVDERGQTAAVKIVQADLLHEPRIAARFEREVQLSRAIAGACTARVLAADLDAAPPWLATEYIPGPTLERYLEGYGPLDPLQLQLLAAGLAEALTVIHAAGVTHRDLTPRNVILSPSGPKIIDFGIAHMAEQTSLTSTGSAIGTPGYVAPEVIRGEPATAHADVFAWGALVCLAASGNPPFGEGRPDQLLYRVLEGQHQLPDLAAPLDELTRQALAVEPSQRPSAGEVAAALTGGPISTDGPDVTKQMRTMLTAGWNVPVPLTTINLAARPQERATQDARHRRPGRHGVAAAITAAALLIGGVALAAVGVPGDEGDSRGPTGPAETVSEDATQPDPTEGTSTTGVPMPNYTGRAADVVAAGLRAQHYTVDTVEVEAVSVQPGRIERTDPDAGDNLDAGDDVTLYVAREPTPPADTAPPAGPDVADEQPSNSDDEAADEADGAGAGDDTLRTHEVQREDTLYSIAEQYYGDGGLYTLIVEENDLLLSDPARGADPRHPPP